MMRMSGTRARRQGCVCLSCLVVVRTLSYRPSSHLCWNTFATQTGNTGMPQSWHWVGPGARGCGLRRGMVGGWGVETLDYCLSA